MAISSGATNGAAGAAGVDGADGSAGVNGIDGASWPNSKTPQSMNWRVADAVRVPGRRKSWSENTFRLITTEGE